MVRITRIQLGLTISLLVLAALTLVSCGRRATQRPAAKPEEPVTQAKQPPAAVPKEPVAQATEHPAAASEETKAPPLTASLEAFLHGAQEALEAGDLGKAKHELEEAREMASDAQKAQLEDILEDLEKGDIEEVEEHLAALMGAAEVSAVPVLHEAQEALEAGDLGKAKHELEEAREMASDAQKAQIEDILEDLEKGELDEVEAHLAAMLAGTPQAMELTLTTGVAAEGHELFEQVGCAQCHGHNAEGGFGPALAGRTRDRVFQQVRNPVGEMPPFSPDQVSDADLEKIAAFIEALTDERGFSGAALRHLQTALEKLETGDALGALEEVEEAAGKSVGQAHTGVEEIEHLLKEGNTHEALDRIQAFIGSGAARTFLDEALEALEAGNLDKVKEELKEALKVVEGSTRAVVGDLIEDLEKGELEEVEEHLKELLGETVMHEKADHEHSPEEHIAGHHDVPEEAEALENPFPATEDSIAKGAMLYARNCAVCHGEQGQGDGPAAGALEKPPANLHEDHVQVNSDGALFWIISHGRPDTPMPPWDNVLSEEERWHIVNFLRTFKQQ